MTVVFMAVDERDAQDIRNIVGRYGKLNMKPADNQVYSASDGLISSRSSLTNRTPQNTKPTVSAVGFMFFGFEYLI